MTRSSPRRRRQQQRARKRPRRGCFRALAQSLLSPDRRVVIITGAGLSVASGVRPFRGADGLWSSVIWERATRASFRQDPLRWYNDFWLPHFGNVSLQNGIQPNAGHRALRELQELCGDGVYIITQNIDGLHGPPHDRLIEAHGRLGYYKCLPAEDSDTDSDSDEEDHRPVHLGHRRKSRALKKLYYQQQQQQEKADNNNNKSTVTPSPDGSSRGSLPSMTTSTNDASKEESNTPGAHEYNNDNQVKQKPMAVDDSRNTTPIPFARSLTSLSSSSTSSSSHHHHVPCRYELIDSITLDQIQPPHTRRALASSSSSPSPKLTSPPLCPACQSPCAPQALFFDEGYHSHDHYQFERMEQWLADCDVLVFCGTSFAVRLTQVALQHAREDHKEVYNFNTDDLLQPSARLNVTNVVGPAQETLPRLLEACRELRNENKNE